MTFDRPWHRWALAALAFLLFIVGLVLIERFVDLDTTSTWIVRVAFILLGLVTAGAILWFLRPVKEAAAGAVDDASLVIKAAQSRLPGGNLTSRAIVLVIGPENATKTTLVARSKSANPELLAGAAPTAVTEAPVPTRDLNLWLMQQSVIAELGGALLQDEKRWLQAIRALRAPRLGAALKSSVVAPRSIVVCVPCDLFSGEGGPDLVEREAKHLRERLTQVSRELGMRVPVYVVFTRLDRVPHFESWAASFTREEVRPPLGASLTFDTESDAATYAERTARRLTNAMSTLVASLGARRVDVLGRETVPDKRLEAYEFPRELKKRTAAMTQFMVELCRPTQLAASPLLRGFYFVGARPVIISEARQAPHAQRVEAVPENATAIFRPQTHAQPEVPAAGGATTRKVPEWVFLDQLFRDVIIADPGAASTARSGVRVQRTRRALVGAAIAACLLLLFGTSVSWANNRGLNNRVLDASRAVAMTQFADETPGSQVMPSTEALRRLETLRGVMDTVRTYNRDGVPWYMQFGLWRGQQLLDDARPVWYEGFRKQLYASSFQAITDSLRMLPPEPRPGDDYGKAYGWLKAYLVNTSETSRSTSDFLAPVMVTAWQRGRTLDADALELARNQFVFFASDLPNTNYFNASANEALVTSTRKYLAQFSGSEQLYRSLIAAAEAQHPAIPVPQAQNVLSAPQQVSGAYTAAGAQFMEAAFRDSDRFSTGDRWVIGDVAATSAVNEMQLINEIRTRYYQDYADAWQTVLREARVVRAGSPRDAAGKLTVLSSAQSPLLQLLSVTAQNTVIPAVRPMFQPVHAATDTVESPQLINESNKPYMDGLLGLQAGMADVASIEGRDSVAVADLHARASAMRDNVNRARVAAGQVAQKFSNTTEAQPVATLVQNLLQAPIVGVEAVLQDVSRVRARVAVAPPAGGGGGGTPTPPPTNPAARALNDAGAALCRSYGPMLGKFPFNRNAIQEASLDEVQKLLVQEYGELWAFQRGALAPYLVKQGNQWVGRPANGLALNPDFVKYFNNAARVSEALFPNGAANPRFDVYAAGRIDDNVQEIAFRHDVKDTRFTKQSFEGVINWPATRAPVARIAAKFRRQRRDALVDSASGTWALFRIVANSQYEGSEQTATATWPAKGKDTHPVTVTIRYPQGVPVLAPGWMGNMLACEATVVR